MPILEPAQPSEPSVEQKQASVAFRVKSESLDLFQSVKQRHQKLMRIVWQNPRGLTPQQVMDAFGTEAAELFSLSDALLNLIKTAKPDDPYGDTQIPYEFTIHDDGTVTVGDPIA